MLSRIKKVKATHGWSSDTSVYNAQANGLLTLAVKIGPRAVAWPDYEIEAIATARIAGVSDDGIRALVKRLHAERERRAKQLLALAAPPVAADQA
jgi:prophage regulatory protein